MTKTDTPPESFPEPMIEKVGMLEKEKQTIQEELELLRLQYEELKSRLLESTMINNNNLKEIQRLQQENAHLRRTPLFIASVIEIGEGGMVILRQHGNNQEVLTKPSDELLQKLTLGTRVAVNNSLAIVRILEKPADVRARVMEVIEAPSVDYQDIGGLEKEIQEVVETVELPLTQPELFASVGIEPPRGVLLYGPPGTGKTLLAKAVAHQANATFIRMSGSELVHKFIGEGAQLVRDLFQMARDKAPSIIFIDELDAVGSRRTHDGTTGSAEVNRTMMQLLSELDGFSERGNVRIMAATNRIDMLDPAILRPGRFDRIIEVPLPDEKGREQIFKIHTRKMTTEEDVDVQKIIEEMEGASGADVKAIVTEAGMFAIRRRSKAVNMEDFEKAIDKVLHKETPVEVPTSTVYA
ncbi:proteasome-activating nucleotidase [Methanocella arvoryzae]|uniref:26S proteasome regulatory subunit (Proteasome-activating nucleotidase) n=1 Tax=Methanocella arvoryzae (strain DSM 22066 / NBRC 105507 / MRE50) TaxID=351160 RepID=Q0W546_METAR|nr:proteasome-activating nucleotidase [Methanocella arvoryzae]CAJ36497.1 26S proteasome regulatory subunit (proteasome-activating nucleotidase) [Methanocella arvoryzae MRE50]